MMRRLFLAGLLASACASAPSPAADLSATPEEQEAYRCVDGGQYVRARELAESALAANPGSIPALYVLGCIYREGEGNLPRARHFLERSKGLAESRYGADVADEGAREWHDRILHELAVVFKEMDRPAEALEVLRLHDSLYEPDLKDEYGWHLMKLGRTEEAEKLMREQAGAASAVRRASALNTLAAIAIQNGRYDEGYRYSHMMLDEMRAGKVPRVAFIPRNAAITAIGVHRFNEAEALLTEAARYFDRREYTNPWTGLASLFLAGGRFPDAIRAVREMNGWAYRTKPSLDQQSWAERRTLVAALLEKCGYPLDALPIARGVCDKPDRRGGASTKVDQAEAGNLVFYRHALQVAREAKAEEMSWCRWREYPRLAYERLEDGLAMWAAGKRATALIMEHGRLSGCVRFYRSNSINLPGYVRPELVEMLGSGMVETELGRLRRTPGAIPKDEAPYLTLMFAECLFESGRWEEAGRSLAEAIETLPEAEVLLRARARARLARVKLHSGDTEAAMAALASVMKSDPAVLRSLGMALPVRVEAAGGAAAREAARMLNSSPRFESHPNGFTITVVESGAGLAGTIASRGGEVLCRVVTPTASSQRGAARSFCRELHEKAFAARVDLPRTGIASLTGATLARDSQRAKLSDTFMK